MLLKLERPKDQLCSTGALCAQKGRFRRTAKPAPELQQMASKSSVWTRQCGSLKRTLYVVVRTKLDRRVRLISARDMNRDVIQMRDGLQLLTLHQRNVRSKLCSCCQFDTSRGRRSCNSKPLQYFHAVSGFGSDALLQPKFRCSLSRLLILIASDLALSTKLGSPVRFVTHSNPGAEHIDIKDDGPKRSIRVRRLTLSASFTHRDIPSRA